MTTNWNVIWCEYGYTPKYAIGDIFTTTNTLNWRLYKFNGLKIERIYNSFGCVCMEFDFSEWQSNNPEMPKKDKIPLNFKIEW